MARTTRPENPPASTCASGSPSFWRRRSYSPISLGRTQPSDAARREGGLAGKRSGFSCFSYDSWPLLPGPRLSKLRNAAPTAVVRDHRPEGGVMEALTVFLVVTTDAGGGRD